MSEHRLVKGCCPHDCQDTCAWVAHVEDDRVVRVEGAREHPFTRGVLCAKINDYEKRTYAPDRLLYPLRRTGVKGAGEFERISWDAALDIIAKRFLVVVSEYGGEALLPLNYLGSMGIVQRRALMRLFHALGASQQTGSICGAAGNVLAAEGHPRGFDPEQIVDSRMIIVWGANLLTTSHHHWHFIEEARRRNGAIVVCVDPRRTRTAERCDRHLAVRPGTDRFLAASLAHVMFAEDLVDRESASAAADLDALRAEVAHWTPARASEVCDVPVEEIVRLAREFAAARPATIRGGVAPQQTAGGEAFVRSLSALAILGGHWRLPGGGLFIEASPVLHEGRAARPDLLPHKTRRLDLARLGDNLTSTTLAPPIMGLMVFGTNPAVVQQDVARVRAGLAREDLFTVVVEHFLTDTARYADIVLPSTTQLEHFDIVGAWGHHYVSVNNPAIQPLGESKSHGEMMRLIAARMGLDIPALRESDEEIAASSLPDDISLDALKVDGWKKTFPGPPNLEAGTLRLAGITAGDVPDQGNRLQLLTPKAHYFLNSSYVNLARQRRRMDRPTLEMNAADAEVRGLQDGDRVTIRNAQGELTAWLHVGTAIRAGVVSLTGKWWSHPAATSAVANVLTPSAWTPGGQPTYNDTFVDVIAAPLPDRPVDQGVDPGVRALELLVSRGQTP
jgi:anaerobic selenocysteine-containing dehydrogenase